MNDAIGLLETKGLVALVEATDAMAKAANVQKFEYLTTKALRPHPRLPGFPGGGCNAVTPAPTKGV